MSFIHDLISAYGGLGALVSVLVLYIILLKENGSRNERIALLMGKVDNLDQDIKDMKNQINMILEKFLRNGK